MTGGNVLTMIPSRPCAEAVAAKGDRIVKVGTNEEISQLVGETTEIIQLNGKTVVPGFIDSHIHVADFGRLLNWIDLSDANSITEMQKRLKTRVEQSPKGKWLLGRGLDPTRFAEKRFPTRFDLDSVSPANPVVFYHQSGQVCVVNSKALESAGLTTLTPVPEGGDIDRDAETGELNGVLRDTATNLIWNVIPEPSEEELLEVACLACEKIVEAGVTSVHWMVLAPIELSIIQRLHTQNMLPLRVYVVVPENILDNMKGFQPTGGSELTVGGAVISADGYLAAKTAALFQPYTDGSANGKLLCTQEEMTNTAEKILKMGLQLVIHAMGDKAVDAALTAIEQVSKETPRKDMRNRIEQAAVLNQGLIKRIKQAGVIVSVQPLVVASEFSVWSATENLGAERARWLYPLKTLLKKGIRVIGGSDCPMEPLSPLLGIKTAVTRKAFPEEQVTVDEALCMYTVDAAYSSKEENIKGSIETGKLADLTVLSNDPKEVLPSEIEKLEVEMTIVGGRVVYSKH
ncbi:amidohydrolase [Candidatus Bathyarchaeota archaeon]|nr:amidohydrolase [Candidatus Bathyarchaeota archaeon]